MVRTAVDDHVVVEKPGVWRSHYTLRFGPPGLLRRSPRQVIEGYRKYEELFNLLGDHKVRGRFLREQLDEARVARDRAYTRAAPLIEQERAAERRRQEQDHIQKEQARVARERKEAEKRAAQEQQRAEADRQRLQEEEQRRERAKDSEMQAKGWIKVDDKWISPEQAELIKLRTEIEAMKNKPAKVIITATWKYKKSTFEVGTNSEDHTRRYSQTVWCLAS